MPIPLEHYLIYGWRLGFKPREDFDVEVYVSANMNDAKDVCPLVHYYRSGRLCGGSDLVDFVSEDTAMLLKSEKIDESEKLDPARSAAQGKGGASVAQTDRMEAVHKRGAISTGRRNTFFKFLCRRMKAQRLPGSLIDSPRDFVQMRLRVYRQVGSLGEVLS